MVTQLVVINQQYTLRHKNKISYNIHAYYNIHSYNIHIERIYNIQVSNMNFKSLYQIRDTSVSKIITAL